LTRVFVVLALAAVAATPSWTEPRVLSDTGRALGPEFAVNASGAAIAVWDSETGPDCAQAPASLTCIHTVEATWRDHSGGAWDSPVAIARPGIGDRPTVAMNDAGRAAIIWVHDIGRDRVVQATYRVGPTAAFPNPNDLSAAVLEVRSHHVALDAAGNAVAVWAERHIDTFEVAAEVRSAASGTWGAPIVLSTGAVSAGPALGVTPAGDAFVAWVEGGVVRVVRGDLSHGAWDSPVAVSSGAGSDVALAVNAAGDAVVVSGGQAVSRPVAGVWSAAALVDGSLVAAGPGVAIAADGTAVAVWAGGDGYLRAAVRPAAGAWSDSAVVAPATASAPQVAIDPGGNAIALWRDDADLMAALRPAVAGAWQPPERLAGGETSSPRVALDAAGNGVAVWNSRSGDRIPVFTADFPAAWQPTLDNTQRPTIRGRARVGRTVVCNRGLWAGTVPIRYGYGWLRNSRLMQSAHGLRYRIRRADAGARLACRITATNPARTMVVTSPPVRVSR
jgi:hypothetical protein